MRRKTLVIGDIHGCHRELVRLLAVSGFRHGKDRLVLCGDLLDRGPDSAGVLRQARLLGAESVLGNHEEKHLRYRRHALRKRADPSYVIPMSKPHPAVHDRLTDEDFAYMEKLPLVIDVGSNTVVVHGGFSSDSPRWRPKLASCRVRYVNTKTRKFVPSSDGFTQSDGTTFWTTRYLGTKNVIYGHHSYWEPKKLVRPCGLWTLGIDTGCCFGRKLTGYWVEDGEFVSTPAYQRYYSDISEPRQQPLRRGGVQPPPELPLFGGQVFGFGSLRESRT